MMIRIGPGGPGLDDEPRTLRDRLRQALIGLSSMPQAFRLVWEAQPALTLALALATLLQAVVAPAGAWVGKLTICKRR